MTEDRGKVVAFNAAVAAAVTRGETYVGPARGRIADNDDAFGDACDCAQCRRPKVITFPGQPGVTT